MVVFFLLGGVLILVGTAFALDKQVYFSFDILGIPIKEGKLSEHDAMWMGIAIALIGVLLIGLGFIFHNKNKSKPE